MTAHLIGNRERAAEAGRRLIALGRVSLATTLAHARALFGVVVRAARKLRQAGVALLLSRGPRG